MTSERAIRANRRNSQGSTGPRTLAGKAQTKQNARKHGLSAVDPNFQAEADVEKLTQLIVGDHSSDVGMLEAARAVAEAQVQFQRVQTFKTILLQSGTVRSDSGAEAGHCLPSEVFVAGLVQLERLDRYERRALSQRKFAIRRFIALIDREL